MEEQGDAPAEFLRWIPDAEYQDWRTDGKLRVADGKSEGKYLTVAAELAWQWGAYFCQLGWEHPPGHVVRVVFPAEVAGAVELFGPHIDGIGPAYFAPKDVLAHARVTEVPR